MREKILKNVLRAWKKHYHRCNEINDAFCNEYKYTKGELVYGKQCKHFGSVSYLANNISWKIYVIVYLPNTRISSSILHGILLLDIQLTIIRYLSS